MKKILLGLISISLGFTAYAQQKEGRVVYSRTMQMQLSVDDNDHLTQMLPQSRTDNYELIFGNNQSIWKYIDEEEPADEVNGNGVQIRLMAPGQNDVVFSDFNSGKKTEQRDMMERKFIVTDSIRKLDWKLTNETQTLLGHTCQKAIAQRAGKRTQMTMDNGKMERKEIADTSIIVAWFTTDIPVPAGPEVQGQLPGLILELNISNGRVIYRAIELFAKADLASIKEPTKGKKVTPDEYVKETAKMMDEMQKNQGSGNRVIRMN